MPDTSRPHRPWLVFAVVGLAQLMVVLDVTIVNIALPSAQRDLGFGTDARQWVVTAYALAFGGLLLLGGRLGDLLGRRRALLAGLLGFAAASALGGAAGSFEALVAARALQGVAGALLAPAALSILATTFTDPRDRGRAYAVFGAIAGSGAAVGLLLGGALTEWLSWRWCMYANLALAVPAAVGALAWVRESRAPRRPRLDVAGAATASLGLFALVLGFSLAETEGWADGSTTGALVAGVVLLGAFVAVESRSAEPLLPLHVVADRDRAGAYVAILATSAALFAVLLFLTYHLQRALGYTPLQTGLAFLPMVGGVILSAGVSNGVLLARIGPRPVVPVALLLAAGGMVALTRLELDSTYVGTVLPALVLLGVGLGATMASSLNTATAGLDDADAGVGSAMVNTSQQVGGSLGLAALSTVFAGAVADAAAVPDGAARAAAVAEGYSATFGWATGIFLAGAFLTAVLFRSGPAGAGEASGRSDAGAARPAGVGG